MDKKMVTVDLENTVNTLMEKLKEILPGSVFFDQLLRQTMSEVLTLAHSPIIGEMAQYIIDNLLRGYRKGYGVDLNDAESNYGQDNYAEWLEAIVQLADLAASNQADGEIERIKRAINNKAQECQQQQ